MSIINNLKLEHRLVNMDSNILEIFKKIGHILTNDNRPLTHDFMIKLVDKLGLPEYYVQGSLETLKNYDYISYGEHASGGIYNIKLTGCGIITYCVNFMEESDSIFDDISSEILYNCPCTNESISEKLDVPRPIVNAVIDYFHMKRYIDMQKTASDTRTIYRVLIRVK